jgi:hypothetical protein
VWRGLHWQKFSDRMNRKKRNHTIAELLGKLTWITDMNCVAEAMARSAQLHSQLLNRSTAYIRHAAIKLLRLVTDINVRNVFTSEDHTAVHSFLVTHSGNILRRPPCFKRFFLSRKLGGEWYFSALGTPQRCLYNVALRHSLRISLHCHVYNV